MHHFIDLFLNNAYWFVGTVLFTLFLIAVIFTKPDKEDD